MFARWMFFVAILLTMTTPRLGLGGLRLNAGDVFGGIAGVCWLSSWAITPSRPMSLRAALWPSIILVIGAASVATSLDKKAALMGIVELAGIWVLPAMAVPNLISTPTRLTQFFTSVCIGSLVAASANIYEAIQTGANGGLPQVWGAAQYLQGYLQVVGLIIAVSRLFAAIGARRPSTALVWALACAINGIALLLTQTRGAWLAAIAAMIVLGFVWRPSVLVGTAGVASVAVATFWGADWATGIRERVQSIFSLDAGLSGFESSLGRLALAFTAWRIFLAHPLLGVGLKNFPSAMATYAPPGMPMAYEMGPNHLLTAVEGPHSTYLSLLAELGVFGLTALLAWQLGAIRRLFRATRSARHAGGSSPHAPVLLAAVTVVAVYSCFFEMNQTGTLVFVSLLVLGYRASQLSPG